MRGLFFPHVSSRLSTGEVVDRNELFEVLFWACNVMYLSSQQISEWFSSALLYFVLISNSNLFDFSRILLRVRRCKHKRQIRREYYGPLPSHVLQKVKPPLAVQLRRQVSTITDELHCVVRLRARDTVVDAFASLELPLQSFGDALQHRRQVTTYFGRQSFVEIVRAAALRLYCDPRRRSDLPTLPQGHHILSRNKSTNSTTGSISHYIRVPLITTKLRRHPITLVFPPVKAVHHSQMASFSLCFS